MTVARQHFDRVEYGLRQIRGLDSHGVIVSFGSHHDDDCGTRGSLSVTIDKSGQTATSKALHLYDAYLMAAAKVERLIEAEKERREKEKAEAA